MSNTLTLKVGWDRVGILFEIILKEEVEDIIDFVTELFFADEPIFRGVGLSELLEKSFSSRPPPASLHQGFCSYSKDLFGVLISMKHDPYNLPADESGSDADNRHRHNKIISFLNQILDMKELEISFQQRGF